MTAPVDMCVHSMHACRCAPAHRISRDRNKVEPGCWHAEVRPGLPGTVFQLGHPRSAGCLEVLENSFHFSGRARRREYWMSVLFSVIASIVLGIVDGVTGLTALNGSIGVLGLAYALAIVIPSLAVGARRPHDIGRSGWWMLLGLVPLVGAIVLIVWYASEGTRGDNAYGADPKLGDDGEPALV